MTSGKKDLLSRRNSRLLLFQAPQAAFVVGFFVPTIRIPVWVSALTVLGGACIANARRCGRLHCYLTGPFYLLAALLILLYGIRVVPLGELGWLWLGLGVVIIGNLLAFIPERIWPRYVELSQPG